MKPNGDPWPAAQTTFRQTTLGRAALFSRMIYFFVARTRTANYNKTFTNPFLVCRPFETIQILSCVGMCAFSLLKISINTDPRWPDPVPPPRLPDRQIMVMPTGGGIKDFSPPGTYFLPLGGRTKKITCL